MANKRKCELKPVFLDGAVQAYAFYELSKEKFSLFVLMANLTSPPTLKFHQFFKIIYM